MSRLWPEKIRIGLFPGQCWIDRGRSAAVQSADLGRLGGAAGLLRALESLLDQASVQLRKGSQLIICVSDSVGPTIVLPWQEKLSGGAELQSYAQLCFEHHGNAIGATWVTHGEFRQHRGHGLAFALPRLWLAELLAVLAARGLQLAAITPVSATAYSREYMWAREGKTLLLIRELLRFNAMVYDGHRLLSCDVEPVTGSIHNAGMRLVRRISARYGEIARVKQWSPGLSNDECDSRFLADCLPNTRSCWLPHGSWR